MIRKTMTACVAAACMLAAAGARAETRTYTLTGLSEQAHINFSETSNLGRFGGLYWMPFRISAQALPSSSLETTTYGFDKVDLALTMPIRALRLEVEGTAGTDSSRARATRMMMEGGLSLSVRGVQPGDSSSFVTTGGHVDITDIQIDLVQKKIFADVVANGVQTSDMAVWSIDALEGPQWISAPNRDCGFSGRCDVWSQYMTDGYLERRYLDNVRLTGLVMTQQASDLMGAAFGLTASGQNYFQDYRSPADWYNNVTFAPVPELNTASMMGLGCALLWGLRRTRRGQISAPKQLMP